LPKYYWARGRETILLPHNLHAQVGRLERDIPLRSLQVGSHRQGVYNSQTGISYTAKKRTNNKKTKVMTELEYDNFPQEVKAIVDTYDDNENLYEECHRIQKELEHIGWTCDYGLDGEVYYVRPTNPIQAQLKFRMPNGKDKYVTKTFNDKKHMRAYIDKVCRQEDCFLDEAWY
jgi:hypothetical protein